MAAMKICTMPLDMSWHAHPPPTCRASHYGTKRKRKSLSPGASPTDLLCTRSQPL